MCVYICIHIHPHTHTHIFNELLLIHKKEGNSATCNNMDGPEGIILSDVSQTEKEKYCMISFICGIRKIWTNREWWFPGGGSEKNGGLFVQGHKLSVVR